MSVVIRYSSSNTEGRIGPGWVQVWVDASRQTYFVAFRRDEATVFAEEDAAAWLLLNCKPGVNLWTEPAP